MARKSRQTLCFEQLGLFSRCPKDLFSALSPDESTLQLIRECESSSPEALDKATEALYSDCFSGEGASKKSEALVYLCRIGIRSGVTVCVYRLANYIDRTEEYTELLAEIRDLLDKDRELLNRLEIKSAINSAIRSGGGYSSLIAHLDPSATHPSVKIFIYCMAKKRTESDALDIVGLCRDKECLSLLALPSFCEGKLFTEQAQGPSAASRRLMLEALGVSALGEWQDFWLRMLYEEARIYGGSDYSHFAKEAINIIKKRPFDGKRDQHLAALLYYMLTKSDEPELRREYENIMNECKFEGRAPEVENAEIREKLIKEGIYISKSREMEVASRQRELGIVINRGKNRYYLEGSLKGHTKREKQHLWFTTLSFPKSFSDEPPTFAPFVIEQVYFSASRFGAQLDSGRATSQIICRCELTTAEARHPFILDLILDIAYISAAKCEGGQILVKGIREDSEYYIFDCSVFIY